MEYEKVLRIATKIYNNLPDLEEKNDLDPALIALIIMRDPLAVLEKVVDIFSV